MIFSTQMMDVAFRYFGKSFHKIIAVNFSEDIFQPIKVDEDEWNAINGKDIPFSEWLGNFMENECHPDDIWVHQQIVNYTNLLEVNGENPNNAKTFFYRRKFDGLYSYAALTVVPGYDGWHFVFVKQLEPAEGVEFVKEEMCNDKM